MMRSGVLYHLLSASLGITVGMLLHMAFASAQTRDASRLGIVHFPVACSSTAQAKFDRGIAPLHNFVYPDTLEAFSEVIRDDPACAMAYWGLAMSQRPNPLVPPFSPGALRKGWEAVKMGLALNPGSAHERDYLAAAEALYRDYDKVDQTTRSRAYARAMGRLHECYPEDFEGAIFYALALNEIADPTDKAFTDQLQAVAILEAEAKTHPDHPGIAHYLIHSYDFAPLAALCLPTARRYGELAPAAPHALHMPSHIYSMLGMWEDSITANLAAETEARKQAKERQLFPGKDHPALPHLMDFRVYAYLQMARDREARSVMDSLRELNPLVNTLAVATGKQAVPARFALDRGRWDEAANLPVLRDGFAAAMAVAHFTRGIGAARNGDTSAARVEIAALDDLKDQLGREREAYWAAQTEIQMRAIAAWIEFVEGRRKEAITAMGEAADLDDASEKNVAMENKLLPIRALLGELYLASDSYSEALNAFETSLKAQPNRFRSLVGAARAARGTGSVIVARQYYRALVGLSSSGDNDRPEIAEAKAYVAIP